MNSIASNFYVKIYSTILGVMLIGFSSCGSDNKKNASEGITQQNEVTNDREINKLYANGEKIYKGTCLACHQANGEGITNAFPPLAKSDYLLADKKRAIAQILRGSSGEITVNGSKYNSAMPAQLLNDEQIADVLNYVLHSWGNNGQTVTAQEVSVLRKN